MNLLNTDMHLLLLQMEELISLQAQKQNGKKRLSPQMEYILTGFYFYNPKHQQTSGLHTSNSSSNW